jgi:two-component system chemotaxis response regulator CheB
MSARIRVLVVDDSAFARKVVREVLASDPGVEVVGIARDGLDALEKIEQLRPDVVTLDLSMPHLDGLGVLEAFRGKSTPRFVVVSTADEQSTLALDALQAGAIDVVHKPTALATDRLYELSTELVEKIKLAARVPASIVATLSGQPAKGGRDIAAVLPSSVRIVVIGASTGGPQALTKLLAEFAPDFPVPLAIVLHMPVGYTAALAQRLDAQCAIRVVEAREGALLGPGTATIARAGVHLKIAGTPDAPLTRLDVSPLGTAHRPSVDVLFATAAEIFGRSVLGVVLTGMGDDGLQGSRAIRDAGGSVITEAESTCVVYGMPRAIFEAGLSTRSVSLDKIAVAISEAL